MVSADAIIIGAGLQGLSTALHLARKGKSVAVLEKESAGRHASGVNAGGVRRLNRAIPEIPLSLIPARQMSTMPGSADRASELPPWHSSNRHAGSWRKSCLLSRRTKRPNSTTAARPNTVCCGTRRRPKPTSCELSSATSASRSEPHFGSFAGGELGRSPPNPSAGGHWRGLCPH